MSVIYKGNVFLQTEMHTTKNNNNNNNKQQKKQTKKTYE